MNLFEFVVNHPWASVFVFFVSYLLADLLLSKLVAVAIILRNRR